MNRRDKWLIFVTAIIVFVVLVLPRWAFGDTLTVGPYYFPDEADSVRVKLFCGLSTTAGFDSLFTDGRQSYYGTIYVPDGYLSQLVLQIKFTGDDSISSWTPITFDRLTSYASYGNWKLAGARWGTHVDSVWLKLYRDGVIIDSAKRNNACRYDTTVQTRAGTVNEVHLDLYEPGVDTAATWGWVFDQSDTGTSGTGVTPSADEVTISGYIKDLQNNAVAGARVDIMRGGSCRKSTFDRGVSGYGLIVVGKAVQTYTDTAGYWSTDILKSSSYDDSTCAYYSFSLTMPGDADPFMEISDVWVAANFNLSDTIAGRQ